MAFLINAYNAFTVELVLASYPALKSIKDLARSCSRRGRKTFFSLLGAAASPRLDRTRAAAPLYLDPRVHAALELRARSAAPRCAARPSSRRPLEAQLEDGMQRFLADRTRNRVRDGRLEVSAIFKWYRDDFERGTARLQRASRTSSRALRPPRLATAPTTRPAAQPVAAVSSHPTRTGVE
jgi:hypothetical protein